MPRFDAREIEHFVDEGEQMFAAAGDERVAGAVCLVEAGVAQRHARVAQDAGQRRAQFVGHVGQEGVVGRVGGFGGEAGLFLRGLHLAARGHVHDAALVNGLAAGRVDDGAHALADPDRAAVAAADFGFPVHRRAVARHGGVDLLPAAGLHVELAGHVGEFPLHLLGVVVAAETRHGRVGAQVVAVQRGLEDALRGVLEDGTEKFLALAELPRAAGHQRLQPRRVRGGPPRSARARTPRPHRCPPAGRRGT